MIVGMGAAGYLRYTGYKHSTPPLQTKDNVEKRRVDVGAIVSEGASEVKEGVKEGVKKIVK
jgi:hypothetical protein